MASLSASNFFIYVHHSFFHSFFISLTHFYILNILFSLSQSLSITHILPTTLSPTIPPSLFLLMIANQCIIWRYIFIYREFDFTLFLFHTSSWLYIHLKNIFSVKMNLFLDWFFTSLNKYFYVAKTKCYCVPKLSIV